MYSVSAKLDRQYRQYRQYRHFWRCARIHREGGRWLWARGTRRDRIEAGARRRHHRSSPRPHRARPRRRRLWFHLRMMRRFWVIEAHLASIRTFSRARYTAMAKSDPPIPLYAMRSVMPLLLIPDRISTYREFIWAHLLRRPVTGLASESFAGSARVVEASMLTRVHLLMAFSLRSARTAMVANIVAAFIFQHALRCSDHRLG